MEDEWEGRDMDNSLGERCWDLGPGAEPWDGKQGVAVRSV